MKGTTYQQPSEQAACMITLSNNPNTVTGTETEKQAVWKRRQTIRLEIYRSQQTWSTRETKSVGAPTQS
jgi:hypothetical protein